MPPGRLHLRRTTINLVLAATLLAAAPASAQDMNIAVSRLGVPADPADTSRDFTRDDGAWRRVMTQLGGSLLPPIITSVGTRGVRGIYVGFESWFTGISNQQEYWHRAAEGDGVGYDPANPRARFVDPILAWGRFNVRKGLPFGFDLGTSIGYLANTTYWTLGLEIRWALFEGFRTDVGWIPDIAIRAAVQTMMGDGEFNITVPSVDLILSEPFVVGNSVEITPSVYGQVAWVFADSELVDLTPENPAFPSCAPDPLTPGPGSTSPPYCTGDGRELNNNVVFPSLRSMRARIGGGLQIRYEWITVLGSILVDAVPPSDLDDSLPDDLPQQWQANVAIGLTF